MQYQTKILGFFFCQAEDGIRDSPVTGVQTCALPIFGSPQDISVRIPHLDQEPENFAQKIVSHLRNSFSSKVSDTDSDFILSIEKVGPKIGAELSNKAILAIVSALGLILFYISMDRKRVV